MKSSLLPFIFTASIILMIACDPQPAGSIQSERYLDITPTSIRVSPTYQSTVGPAELPTSTLTRIYPTQTPEIHMCSPLPGYNFDQIEAAICNPYNPPVLGSDDPHQGVDLAVEMSGMAVTGNPVQAVLDGFVAAIVEDRFPYGIAIMVETPLEKIPLAWMEVLHIPAVIPTLTPHPSLTCPDISPQPTWNIEERSLYLLYAHLLEREDFHLGDEIRCGDTIGKIGQSGNALNPHLHLEARVGPANTRIESMGHYDPRMSKEEMYYYCIWRVSGIFQLLDPVLLLGNITSMN